MTSKAVVFMVQQIITPGMYVLFCLLAVLVGLAIVFGIFYLIYQIVNRMYMIKTNWMTRKYLQDLLKYAENNEELMERKKSLLKGRCD